MGDTGAYHLAELRIIQDGTNPQRCVPQYDCAGWDLLDVGCGAGQTLSAQEFFGAASRHGIDVDEDAIRLGQKMFPGVIFRVASAERIPYPDDRFDLVFSRVALPYTNVPVALREMRRVTKPGGLVWLELHSWRLEAAAAIEALKRLSVRRLVDRTYVLVNSLMLATCGRCIARPWSGKYESIQFAGSMARLMRRSGFHDVRVTKGRHFCISARKVSQG